MQRMGDGKRNQRVQRPSGLTEQRVQRLLGRTKRRESTPFGSHKKKECNGFRVSPDSSSSPFADSPFARKLAHTLSNAAALLALDREGEGREREMQGGREGGREGGKLRREHAGGLVFWLQGLCVCECERFRVRVSANARGFCMCVADLTRCDNTRAKLYPLPHNPKP